MKKIMIEISWIFDYYIAFLMYNDNKIHRYNRYMEAKWGERFKNKMRY